MGNDRARAGWPQDAEYDDEVVALDETVDGIGTVERSFSDEAKASGLVLLTIDHQGESAGAAACTGALINATKGSYRIGSGCGRWIGLPVPCFLYVRSEFV